MPIYEYRCEKCGEPFEKFLRTFSEQGDVVCPRCGSADVKKAVSLFGLSSSSGASDSRSCKPGSL
jgi:putative FmdB family regulatory protein